MARQAKTYETETTQELNAENERTADVANAQMLDEMKAVLAQMQKEREAMEQLKASMQSDPEDSRSESEKRASDAQFDKEAKDWGAVYANMPKVRIKIPLDPLNKQDTTVPVCVNGYNYFIQRGVTVDVPQIVADILENAGYI